MGRQLSLQEGARPVQPDFHGTFGDSERFRRLTRIHLFDVSQEHNVTVNLGEGLDGLAEDDAELLAFESLGGDFAPTGEDGRGVVAGLLVRVGFEGVFASAAGLAETTEAFIARDGENPGAELGVATEAFEIEVDLDHCVLGGVFGLSFIAEQRHEEKVDGPFTGADQVVKQLVFAGEDAANAVCFELGVGGCHRLEGEMGEAKLD